MNLIRERANMMKNMKNFKKMKIMMPKMFEFNLSAIVRFTL